MTFKCPDNFSNYIIATILKWHAAKYSTGHGTMSQQTSGKPPVDNQIFHGCGTSHWKSQLLISKSWFLPIFTLITLEKTH